MAGMILRIFGDYSVINNPTILAIIQDYVIKFVFM